MSKIEQIAKDLVMPILEKNNFELVDVEYKKEGSHWYLRVYIDKEGGITLDDCQLVSEYLSDRLDEADPIEHSYILEVSSPGLDRPLKKPRDFERNIGKEIEISLYSPIDKRKKFEGELIEFTGDKIIILYNGERKEFDMKNVSLVKPVIKF
ncbi:MULTISPECIES: ribosome maturation factor RimP [Thermoanaerobacter]|jgi:ribosome maturation factor RimP|uniref:Ribosome maturation factor RimP n=1 Tax=Thermoanaerobacter uzonensis DSM 18761 TaxID=1123369 RepID=A0A1M4UWA3_9THEO|nr:MULTISPECIES: ribosome maturation factor RimP [Thermoanaerobacter]SHE60968.1 ribosome maturation factor RimP [Thermoanaerobacter uzonensis DSM 18761]